MFQILFFNKMLFLSFHSKKNAYIVSGVFRGWGREGVIAPGINFKGHQSFI